jgi:hypothetical protein
MPFKVGVKKEFRKWVSTEISKSLTAGESAESINLNVGKTAINPMFSIWCSNSWDLVPKERIINGVIIN